MESGLARRSCDPSGEASSGIYEASLDRDDGGDEDGENAVLFSDAGE